jgi:hypothetical protein
VCSLPSKCKGCLGKYEKPDASWSEDPAHSKKFRNQTEETAELLRKQGGTRLLNEITLAPAGALKKYIRTSNINL